ncbi:MAG TPA: hypothetical protein VN228_06410 [Pyrinomonadaceae bacterium]|nr:hypothetical protein [Pyrinomonadaceae bacterium]
MPLPRYRDDIVLLTGAGASAYLGMPTLDEVLKGVELPLADEEVAALILKTRKSIEGNIHRISSAVFEEMIAKLKYYLQVTETLTADFTFRDELGSLPSVINSGSLAKKWKSALTRCYRLLISEYGPNKIRYGTPEFAAAIELIGELAKLNSGELHIYTTNYDCVYHVMASRADSLSFFSHIDNVKGTFKEVWCPARPDLEGAGLPSVYVHRLHGCVAWFTQEEPYEIREIYGAGSNLEVDDENLLHKMCIKLIASQEIGRNVAFLSAYEEFCNHLESAKALIIWGSSFRDMEVLRAINNAFPIRRTSLPVYYINPFRSEADVIDKIRITLRPVPVVVRPDFKPKQIKWLPRQPGRELIRAVLDAV